MKPNRSHITSFVFALLVSGSSGADEVDISSYPVAIEADSAQLDEKAGTSLYKGNVVLERGPMSLKADSVEVFAVEKRLSRVVALGGPVRFAQTAVGQTPEVKGEGKRVEYLADTGVLTLTGEAQLWQGANRFSGNIIQYDTRQNLVSASGGAEGGQRVQVIIQPRAAGAGRPAP